MEDWATSQMVEVSAATAWLAIYAVVLSFDAAVEAAAAATTTDYAATDSTIGAADMQVSAFTDVTYNVPNCQPANTN